MPDDNKRLVLRATIEAKRISRLGRDNQEDLLEKVNEQLKSAKGDRRLWLETLIGIIKDNQEREDEAAANRTFADYGGGYECGGCGSNAGNENG